MQFRHEGNGHDKVRIHTTQIAHGYVIIHADDIKTIVDGTPVFVSLTLEKWLKDNPTVRVRATLPIVKDGQTIAVHVWFDA
jgi:hypothetical protein